MPEQDFCTKQVTWPVESRGQPNPIGPQTARDRIQTNGRFRLRRPQG